MAISEAEERLYHILANDPIARPKMMAELKRIHPEIPLPEYDARVATETALEDRIKPFQEKIESLQKQLEEKTKIDLLESRRSEVRGAPFYFNDDQIKELEDRLLKDKNMYGSYAEAARYYQYQDMPTHPSSAPISPFTRKTPGSEDWRDMVKDPKSGIFDKRKRREILSKKWVEGGGANSLVAAMRHGR